MLKTLRKLTGNNQLLLAVCVFVILFAIFYPRAPLIGANLSAHLGNIRGTLNLEAMETLEEGFDQKTLVLFYAPWCKHCQELKPKWDDAMKNNKTNVRMTKINCDENKELAEKYGVNSFPTIYFLPRGLNNPKDRIKYDGERSGEALLAFISNK